MKYLCLRNCAVDRYYEKDRVYNLPDTMVKHPKNFACVEIVPLTNTTSSGVSGETTVVTLKVEDKSEKKPKRKYKRHNHRKVKKCPTDVMVTN